ncbi:MAG: AraC family transcriptional regulator ligand-binding domain-containing protein [Polyangiaceae bacterium]
MRANVQADLAVSRPSPKAPLGQSPGDRSRVMAGALPKSPIMRSKILPLFLSHLEARTGRVAPGLIGEYSLPEDAQRLEVLSLPLDRFRALCSHIARLLGDPLLGLNAAIGLRPGAYGIIEFLLRSAPTPRDALQQLVRFVPLFNSLLRLSLVEHGDTAVVDGEITGEPLCFGREGNEFVLAVFVAIGRQLAGEEWAPEHVSFAHSAPGTARELEELQRFLRCRSMSFDTGHLTLRFKVSDLGKRVRTGDGALHEFLEREACALAPPTKADDLDQAREAIRAALRSGEPSVRDVARMLGTSARTLQRRLAERHTSFRAMVDEVREALAREYLDQSGKPLKEVAAALGYADVRAFGRAYKRWTGSTPGR